jgi:hypothetical protein
MSRKKENQPDGGGLRGAEVGSSAGLITKIFYRRLQGNLSNLVLESRRHVGG